MVEAKPNGNPENRIDCVAVRRVYSSAVAGQKMLAQGRNMSDRGPTGPRILEFDLVNNNTNSNSDDRDSDLGLRRNVLIY